MIPITSSSIRHELRSLSFWSVSVSDDVGPLGFAGVVVMDGIHTSVIKFERKLPSSRRSPGLTRPRTSVTVTMNWQRIKQTA
ncbi:hypothetical protein L2E82_17003 [Cichorium intybus]|uniref:Uncharacterized protein n=1 Tax=Cichorium intybus TaxID=13427 RepID=A0ACB9F744_CICIN|nr:hypothetical protein L2E82_17003 [Cichorium intybus]